MKKERWLDVFAKIADRCHTFQVICRLNGSNNYLFTTEFLAKKMRALAYHLELNVVSKNEELTNEDETGVTVIVPLKEGYFVAQSWFDDELAIFDFSLNKYGEIEHALALLCRFFELELEEVHLRTPEYIGVNLTKDIE